MKNKPIIIIHGDPKSIFLEIFFKALKLEKFRSPIILISSHKILKSQMKIFNFKRKINLLDFKKSKHVPLDNKAINLIDIKLNISNIFIKKSFDTGIEIMKNYKSNKLINGPITKKKFLNKKYPGITEYIANKMNVKNFAMLIYNKDLSVSPLTTHVPIKYVSKKIKKKKIFDNVKLINNFYLNNRGIKPRIGVVGLNPHCESTDNFNEDDKIIKPAIKYLSKNGYKITGPFSADTIFLKKNRRRFDVILGMYHDQVLTPLKTIYEYDAINITLGLPFTRISPDHGPNLKMVGKNLSNPLSLINAIKFLDKID